MPTSVWHLRQDGSTGSRPASLPSLRVISGQLSPGSGSQFPHLNNEDNKLLTSQNCVRIAGVRHLALLVTAAHQHLVS